MITIIDKRRCCGCGACVNACPYNIISLQEDEEGFIYPKVESDKCVNCHLCEKSCPFLQELDTLVKKDDTYPLFYAGQLKNKEDLLEVSSGGAFWAFAEAILSQNGIVYGAIQQDVDNIFHFRADNIETAKKIRRSKYFQSDTGLIFRQVKDDLKKERIVLFSGTGCQIAGLITFLGKEYENLYTCDVVCHGVPSRKVWRKYRKEKEEREGKQMKELVFRDKSAGWSNNQYRITYNDGSIEKEASPQQLFHTGYLSGLFSRPSCGHCIFATLPRCSDITLADYWKYEGRFHQHSGDLGVSLITINTPKGHHLLELSSKSLSYESTKAELALNSCKHLMEHPSESSFRTAFFKLLDKRGYFFAIDAFFSYIKRVQLYNRIFKISSRIKKHIISILTPKKTIDKML